MEELSEKEVAQLEVFQLVLGALFRQEIKKEPKELSEGVPCFHATAIKARELCKKAGIGVIE